MFCKEHPLITLKPLIVQSGESRPDCVYVGVQAHCTDHDGVADRQRRTLHQSGGAAAAEPGPTAVRK